MSEAEWEVMRVVWSHPGATSRELLDKLMVITSWKESTIKTLIRRLVGKDVLRQEKEDGLFHYYPNISEQTCQLGLIQKDLARVCDKEKASVWIKVLKTIPISKEDIKIIQEVVATLNPIDNVPCNCAKGQCQCQKEEDDD